MPEAVVVVAVAVAGAVDVVADALAFASVVAIERGFASELVAGALRKLAWVVRVYKHLDWGVAEAAVSPAEGTHLQLHMPLDHKPAAVVVALLLPAEIVMGALVHILCLLQDEVPLAEHNRPKF